jgi:hypothetical protein
MPSSRAPECLPHGYESNRRPQNHGKRILAGKMKILFLCSWLLAAVTSEAGAQIVSRQSIHLQPIGSVVSSSFMLVNKVIPLPEGEFTLVATDTPDSKLVYGDGARQPHRMIDVVLGQIVDHKLRAAVAARTVLAWGGGRREWVDEPCKREDTLFRLDRVPFMKRSYAQNCLMVNHVVNDLGQSATGLYAKFAAWVKDQGGATPIATVIDARVTRIEIGEFLVARYVFNPEAYGCDSESAGSWTTSAWHKTRIGKDAEKSRFVNGVIEFGKAMQVRLNEAFEGRAQQAALLASATPALLRCDGVPAEAPPPARTTTEKPFSAGERLRTLEDLRERKLISPAEYEERRRKILDSL